MQLIFILCLAMFFIAIVGAFWALFTKQGGLSSLLFLVSAVSFVGAVAGKMFVVVPTSTVGVVTSFGQVETSLPEGLHFVAPWKTVYAVDVSTSVASAKNSEAASKDMQKVHSDITVNFYVIPNEADKLFKQNPSLTYKESFVIPILYEVFKAVVATHTAEELLSKRDEVSAQISQLLNQKLKQYHIAVQSVQMVNFGFSAEFDKAIEEKVTASQRSATAQRNLEKVQFEAQQRIVQAEAEAKAIKIQAEAIDKQGGIGYVQLKAVEKWDGKLPQVSGGSTPFINLNTFPAK